MVVLGGNIAMMSAADQSPNVIKVDEQDHYHEDWIPPFDFRGGVQIKTNEKFSDYYDLYEEIGEGKFGKVYRCVEKATKLILAAKCIRLKRDADLQKVENEVNIMTHMRHKCIAQIYDAFATSTNDVILIMEIVEGGELFDRVVDENYILTEMAVAMIVSQICEAIRYIHSQNIIHLDLKPENIMCVTQTGNQIKLIDFGLAQYFDGQSDLLFMAGTPEFAAPEVIKYEPLDFHTDMWSVGVITYILLSGQSPFLGDNVAITYCNVERGKWEFCEEFRENCISEEAQDFILKLLVVEKNKRMLPEECLKHPWIVRFREKSLRNKSQIDDEKPLDVGKLRNYVRNKRFRRLVFGVLFINTVVRMMNTLQVRKSDGGIQYVKQMLNVVQQDKDSSGDGPASDVTSPPVATLMKTLFSKRRRDDNVAQAPEANEGDKNNLKSGDAKLSDVSKSLSGEELHMKMKRTNKGLDGDDIKGKSITFTATIGEATSGSSGVEEESGATSATTDDCSATGGIHSKRRDVILKKSKRVKSATRKASSTEQAPKKRTKTSTPSSEQLIALTVDATAGDSEPVGNTSAGPSTSKTQEVKAVENSSTFSKLKALTSAFEQKSSVNNGGDSFQLPVACAKPLRKTVEEEPMCSSTLTLKKPQNSSIKGTNDKAAKEDKDIGVTSKKKTIRVKKVGESACSSATKPTNDGASDANVTPPKQEIVDVRQQILSATKVQPSVKDSKREQADKTLGEKDRPPSTTGGKSKVSAMLEQLKQHENNAGGSLKMAVTGFIPPPKRPENYVKKKVANKGHGSAEDLTSTTNESSSESPARRRKMYNRGSRNKTSALTTDANSSSDEQPAGSSDKSKILSLQLQSKTVTEHKTTVKKTHARKSTVAGEDKAGGTGTVMEEEVTNISQLRQRLRSTGGAVDAAYSKATKQIEKDQFKCDSKTLRKDTVSERQQSTNEAFELRQRIMAGVALESGSGSGDKTIGRQVKLRSAEELRMRVEQAGSKSADESDVKCSLKIEKCHSQTAKLKSGRGEVEQKSVKLDLTLVLSSTSNGEKTAKKGLKKIGSTKKKGSVSSETVHRSMGDLKGTVSETPRSLNDSSRQTAVSHDALLTDALEWASLSKKRSAEIIGAQRPRSELNVSRKREEQENSQGDTAKKTQSLQFNNTAVKKQNSVADYFDVNDDDLQDQPDAFDFRALRMKLQQRISGVKDDDDMATEAENRHKCELRVQLHDSENIKRTMKKWMSMDRENKDKD